jgi:hypothetical protein
VVVVVIVVAVAVALGRFGEWDLVWRVNLKKGKK